MLHLFIGKGGDNGQPPVAKVEEHLTGFLIAAVRPGIAQTGIGLVHVVPRHPVFPHDGDVAFLNLFPGFHAVGDASYVSVAMLLLAAFQFRHHVIHALLAGFVARGGIVDGEGGEIMSADVSVQVGPVGENLPFRGQSRFFEEGGEQAIDVVLKQYYYVEVASMLEGAVQQLDLAQRESVAVELVLGGDAKRSTGETEGG